MNGGTFDIVARQGWAIVALLVLAGGVALGHLPRSRLPRALAIPLAGLGALALLTALSLSWASSAEQSLAELARIIQIGSVIGLAWLLLNRHTWTAAIGGMTTGALLIAAIAVASRLFPGLLPSEELVEQLQTRRLSYPLEYWNAVGSWGSMSFAMALAWSAHARSPWVRSAVLALAPVAALAIYFSFSRWAVVALLVGIVVAVVASHHRWTAAINLTAAAAASGAVILVARSQSEILTGTGGEGAGIVVVTLVAVGAFCAAVAALGAVSGADRLRMPRLAARGATALTASVALALVVAAFATGLVDRAWDEFTEEPQAGRSADPEARLVSLSSNRSIVYETALEAFESEPVRGIGPGAFAAWWRQHGEGREVLTDAHSLYIEQLAELGVPGLIAVVVFVGGLGMLVVAARLKVETPRRAGAAAAGGAAFAVYLVHAGLDWMWEYPAIGILGLGSGAIVAMELASARSAPLRDRRWRAVAVAIIGLAAAIQLPGYMSTLGDRSSERSLADGDLRVALERADSAVSWAPWAGSPRAQRGVVQEARGELAAASRSYGEAIDRDPEEWSYHLQLARVEAERGRLQSALRSMIEGRRLNPRSLVVDEEIVRLRGLLVNAEG